MRTCAVTMFATIERRLEEIECWPSTEIFPWFYVYVYIVSIKSFISFYIAKMQDQTSSWMRYLWHRMWLKHKASHKDMWTDLIRCLSTWQLTLLGVGNTIGVGIYVLLGVMVKEEAGRLVCSVGEELWISSVQGESRKKMVEEKPSMASLSGLVLRVWIFI